MAEEYATADVISRGRLDIGFVKSGGTEMPSANVNPVRNEERYWEAIGRPEIVWYEGGHYALKDHVFEVLRRITDHFAR